MYRVVPLGIAVVFIGVIVATVFSARLDRWLTRTAFLVFGGRRIEHNAQREQLLRSAAIGIPYREYATKTRMYAVILGISGAVIGIYLGFGILVLVQSLGLGGEFGPSLDLTTFSGGQLVVLCLIGGSVATLAGIGTYSIRWWLPSVRAEARQREIDAGLPRLVAFTYALTRGGMSFPDVLRTVSENEGVFGEGAAEIGVAVRNIDLFNVDLVTATKDLSDATPSEQFRTFTENLSSVLQSGGNLSVFLHEQYERYRDEAEEQQEEILNVLATTAEVYVTIVVAGMLFLVTILLIIGLTAGDTLFIMRMLAYAIIPAVNLLFLGYLLEITRPLRSTKDSTTHSKVDRVGVIAGEVLESDGGYAGPKSEANHERLLAYRHLQSIRETLAAPIQSLLEQPKLILYVTVPIAILVTAYRLPAVLSGGGVDVRLLDDILVQATIFLMGTFAVVYEYSNRRLRRLEASVPEFLERLASLNESGISVVSSFDRVRRSDMGALDEEVDRIWRDIKWGATVEGALIRFEARVKTSSVTGVVTLITNAMKASNEIGPVLRIAANQARSDLRLRRQRRQEMFTYLVVVYISFFVFLVVIGALEYVLIPSLPDMSAFADGPGGAPGIIGELGSGDRGAYQLVFFHTALIQSTLSGLVAGVMGKGSIKDGMKHATIMLTITYLILTYVV